MVSYNRNSEKKHETVVWGGVTKTFNLSTEGYKIIKDIIMLEEGSWIIVTG
jgi:hypothetical protein